MRRPTFSYFRELSDTQWLSRQELEAYQEVMLNRLLASALRHSPWHARRIQAVGLADRARAGEVRLSELSSLPTMTKDDARGHVDRMVWHDVPGGAQLYNTGGSSGTPLIFYFGRTRQASDAAGRMRARTWWGVRPGEPEAYLWGAPVELNKTDRIKTLRDRMVNQLVLNAFEMSPANMTEYLEALQSWQPRCLYGYASSLALLAAHALEIGQVRRLTRLRVVCATGEPLYPHQREMIEQVFGVPAANEFGSRDIGFTAHETPERAMLLLSESIVLEVVDEDGALVECGEMGEAVMTGLCSEAQPFIRYRTGDMVRLSQVPDPGGRGLHVIEEVLGRTTDFVVRPDGTIMHALALIYVLRAVTGVREFKITQRTTHNVHVLVRPDMGFGDVAREKIVAGLQARLGEDVCVEVEVTDSIPVEASGKHRYVTSQVPISDGLRAASSVANSEPVG